jgi:hypothetical protein
MSTLSLPLNFGHRQCDRLLVLSFAASEHERFKILWMALRVWQDFATAREDRREVPADPAARTSSPAVQILEDYIQWDGEKGRFVEEGIKAGFFLLSPISEQTAELILADFFPANASSRQVSVSQLGGIGKRYANVLLRAEASASDQLQLFKAQNVQPVEGASPKELKEATKLIHSICLALMRVAPKSEEWKGVLLEKAVTLVRDHSPDERESVLRWFIGNRSDQRIAQRTDLVLDQFPTFIPEAVQMFARN